MSTSARLTISLALVAVAVGLVVCVVWSDAPSVPRSLREHSEVARLQSTSENVSADAQTTNPSAQVKEQDHTYPATRATPTTTVKPIHALVTARCPVPPFFVITDKTVCPFVLNLCESMLRAGLPIAPLLHGGNASCHAILRATSHAFDKESGDANVTLSLQLRKRILDIGQFGCLFVSYTRALPKNRTKAQYARLLMSKARSWWSWYVAVKEHWSDNSLPGYMAIVDADVQIFPGAVEALSPFAAVNPDVTLPDMVFQRDIDEKNPKTKNGNAGFFVLRTRNPSVERAMRWMAVESTRMLNSMDPVSLAAKFPGGDQHLVYDIVRDHRKFGFSWGSFPRKLVNDGRAAVHWPTTAVHHPHMSGRYKPTNMRRLIIAKQRQFGNDSVTSGDCLPTEVGESGGCEAADLCRLMPL